MESSAPDFAASVQPGAFQVPGSASLSSAADSITQQTEGINFDWSTVNQAVDQLSGVGKYFDQAATTGQGLTAGSETRGGQEDLAGGPQTAAGIGQALMKLGQKGSQQAAAVGGAQQNQSQQFEQQAAQARQQAAQVQLFQMQQQLQLQQQKQQISLAMSKSQQALQLANLQLSNMYNQTIASATNTTNLDTLAANQHNLSQIMGYLGGALGAGSALTATFAGQPGAAPGGSGTPSPGAGASSGFGSGGAGGTGGDGFSTGSPASGSAQATSIDTSGFYNP